MKERGLGSAGGVVLDLLDHAGDEVEGLVDVGELFEDSHLP